MKKERRIYIEKDNLIKKINPSKISKEEYEEITSRIIGFNKFCDIIREINDRERNFIFFIIAILFGIFSNLLVSLITSLYPELVAFSAKYLITIISIILILIIFWAIKEIRRNRKDKEKIWNNHYQVYQELKERGIQFGEYKNKKTLYGKICKILKIK